MAQSAARKKALQHARGILKRLEKNWYEVDTDYYKSLSDMSTRKLQNITRKSVIQSGKAKISELAPVHGAKTRDTKKDYWITVGGEHKLMSAPRVYEVASADIQWDMIKKVCQHYIQYAGRDTLEFGGTDTSAKDQIAGCAMSVLNYLQNVVEPRFKSSNPEDWQIVLVERIKRAFGSIKEFSDSLEQFILLTYEKWKIDEEASDQIKSRFENGVYNAFGEHYADSTGDYL